jgi:hypothetical protein
VAALVTRVFQAALVSSTETTAGPKSTAVGSAGLESSTGASVAGRVILPYLLLTLQTGQVELAWVAGAVALGWRFGTPEFGWSTSDPTLGWATSPPELGYTVGQPTFQEQ